MDPLYKVAREIINSPILIIIVYFLSLLSVILAIIFYYKSRKIKIPFYSIKTNNIVTNYISKVSDIELLYLGKRIPNLSISKIVLWNGGRETIKQEDIAQKDPLQIKLRDNYKILNAKIIYSANPVNNFHITDEDDGTKLKINFDFFQKNEGLIIQLFHTGLCNDDIKINGTIIGGKQLKRIVYPFYNKAERKKQLLIHVGIFLVFCFLIWLTFDVQYDKIVGFVRYYLLFLYIIIFLYSLILTYALYFFIFKLPEVLKSFEEKF